MTINIVLVLVIGILRTENGWTNRACEMLDMEFFVYKRSIGQ